jgi:hypothetical protein
MNKRIVNFLIAMMLSLSILLPTALTPVKGSILLLALIAVAILYSRGGAHFARFTLIAALFYICTGLLWSLFGLVKGNPGALAMLTVMGVYPLVFTFLASAYKTSDGLALTQFFTNLALFLGFFTLLYISAFLLMPQNALQLFMENVYKDDAVVDAAESYFKFTLPNISSCIFLFPFLIAGFVHSNKRRISTGLAIIAMLAIMLLSGRRGFFLAVIGGLLIAYLITYRPRRKFNFKMPINTQVLFILLAITIFLAWFFTSFYGAEFYLDQIKSILNFTTNESNVLRANQFDSMMAEFTQSPLFGAGAGAAAQYIRSNEQPWAYELAYVAFLFHYGVVGFAIYAAGVLLLTYHLISQVKKNGRNSFEFFYLTGFMSFMIANATNPYLAKFDYMWVFFIPVAIMNSNLLCKMPSYATHTYR